MSPILENGKLNVAWVDALSPKALSDWIWRRLHETDTDAPDDPRQNVGQAYLVGAIYPTLKAATRAEVRDALLHFLLQLEEGHPDWQGRPGDELLLLVMQLRDARLVLPVKRMAERGTFLQGDAPDEPRHARLVQTLAALGEKMPVDFWKAQLQRDPARYANFAFTGMLRHSLYHALGLLGEVDLSGDDLRMRLHIPLRGLLKRYSLDDLLVHVRDVREMWPPETQAFIKTKLPELDPISGDREEPVAHSRQKAAVMRSMGYLKSTSLVHA